MRQQVTAAKAAPPKGVYSPAIIAEGRLVFVSGQTPIDPQTGAGGFAAANADRGRLQSGFAIDKMIEKIL